MEILETYQRIDAQTAAELRRTAVAFPNPAAGEEPSDAAAGEIPAEDHKVPEGMVRGLTTFGELKSWGVTEEMWMEKFNLPMGSRAAGMKDWAEETGIPMSEIKPAAQDMVDSAVDAEA